jgi:TIR domain
MADIFISYGRADRPHAQRIASVLEGHGWAVWWDRKILAGDTFEKTIQRALNEARCIVVLWSAGSVTSSWVKDEATDGKRRNILVPVLIDEVDIPLGFRQLHAVSLLDAAGEQDLSRFDDLVASVDNVLRRPAPAAEEPRVAGEPIESSRRPTPSPIEAIPSPRDANARRSAGTVSRSYLYAALGLVVLFAIAAIWERFGIGERFGSRGARPPDAAGAPNTIDSTTGPATPTTAPQPVTVGQASSRDKTHETVAGAPGVIVSGTGQGFYYVFDSAGAKQLASSLTNRPIDLFPGDYIVAMHGVRRAIQIETGRRTTVPTGRVAMSGAGNHFYYVHDATGQTQLGSSLTNGTMELFPGDYTVVLHGVRAPVTVQAGRDTTVATGAVVVPGSGSSFYYVYDERGEKQLASALTNTALDLIPGSYLIGLNESKRSVRVAAGQRITVGG